METLKYKDFNGSVEFSLEDRIMFGKILFINDLIMYEGNTIDELEQSFHTAVNEYLEFCKKHDKQPDKPMNGAFNVRITPKLHRQLALKALKMDCSLNACVSNAIQFYLEHYTLEQERQRLAHDLQRVSFELTTNVRRINDIYMTSQIDTVSMLTVGYSHTIPGVH